jgi:hypothetical protein
MYFISTANVGIYSTKGAANLSKPFSVNEFDAQKKESLKQRDITLVQTKKEEAVM